MPGPHWREIADARMEAEASEPVRTAEALEPVEAASLALPGWSWRRIAVMALLGGAIWAGIFVALASAEGLGAMIDAAHAAQEWRG